jgi:hypothetical protein
MKKIKLSFSVSTFNANRIYFPFLSATTNQLTRIDLGTPILAAELSEIQLHYQSSILTDKLGLQLALWQKF